MAEVRERVTVHIEAEEAIRRKRVNKIQKQGRYKHKDSICSHHSKTVGTSFGGRAKRNYVPYVAKRSEVRTNDLSMTCPHLSSTQHSSPY